MCASVRVRACVCTWLFVGGRGGGGAHIRQAGDKDEGSCRVGPGQLGPDLPDLAEAGRHLLRRAAVFVLQQGLQLPADTTTQAVSGSIRYGNILQFTLNT